MDLIQSYCLTDLFYKNTVAVQKKILNEIERIPSNIQDGYVYCFKPVNFLNTQTEFKLKIGRTYRDAEERIDEQHGVKIYFLNTVFYFKLERMCHLFFRFANVRGPNEGNEMFLFCEKYGIKMNDVFAYINKLDTILKYKFDKLYNSVVPISLSCTNDNIHDIDIANIINNNNIDDNIEDNIDDNTDNPDIVIEPASGTKIYECKCCLFITNKLFNFNKHCATAKHLKQECVPKNSNKIYNDKHINYICECAKVCNSRQSLAYHQKHCKSSSKYDPSNTIVKKIEKVQRLLGENPEQAKLEFSKLKQFTDDIVKKPKKVTIL
jgi:hypothetical protein